MAENDEGTGTDGENTNDKPKNGNSGDGNKGDKEHEPHSHTESNKKEHTFDLRLGDESPDAGDHYSLFDEEEQKEIQRWGDFARLPTERAMAWLHGDTGFVEKAEQFSRGVADFIRNYNSMVKANTIGADRYFHCMANCESTQEGPGGRAAAEIVSYGREALDLPKNVMKGMSLKDAIDDGKGDMRANRVGQGAGQGDRCSQVCRGFKPNGLP